MKLAHRGTERAVVSWISHHAARTPDRIALRDLGRGVDVTYGELDTRIRSLARSLAERHGVGPGDRVAVLSRTDGRVLEVLHACALLGAIAVPMNWRLTATELTAIGRDCTPTVLFAETWAAETAGEVAAAVGAPLVRWAGEPGEADDYEEFAASGAPATWVPRPVHEDADWTIIYTSGTTGTPKGVRATHRGSLATMLGIGAAMGVSRESRCLTVLPLFHVAGLQLFAEPVLFAGGTVVLARTFDPGRTLEMICDPQEPVTHLCGVPAHYQFMQQLPEFADAPLRPFTAVVGGSPVPRALVEGWAARGVALTTVFGITEAGACVTSMPPGRELERNGTIGLPMLYTRCRIRSAGGAPVALGETGELQVAGPTVTPGYWNRPDATADALTEDGWLRTGDAATVESDGYLTLVDRWKDMYISGGENVYPAEVENALHDHPSVAQAAVVGAPHSRWGESGVAFVVTAREQRVDERSLLDFCAERLARYKVPTRVVVVDALPRNATGKVLKAPLRELAGRSD